MGRMRKWEGEGGWGIIGIRRDWVECEGFDIGHGRYLRVFVK